MNPGPYVLGPLEDFVSPASTPSPFNLNAMFLWQILITHSITGIQIGAVTNIPWHPLSIYLSSKVGHVPEAWPISIFHPFGFSELHRAGHLSQVGPMNSGPGFLLELLRKGLSLPTEFAKLVSRSHHELGSFLKKINKTKESRVKRWSMTYFLKTSFGYLDLVLFTRYTFWTFLLY